MGNTKSKRSSSKEQPVKGIKLLKSNSKDAISLEAGGTPSNSGNEQNTFGVVSSDFSEGELQLQALSDVCLSYLDHLQFIIDSGKKNNSEIGDILASLKENVQSARQQLDRFNDSLAKPHLIKVYDKNEHRNPSNKLDGDVSLSIAVDDNDVDMFDDLYDMNRNRNTYGWIDNNIKRVGFDTTHTGKVYDIDCTYKNHTPIIVTVSADAKLFLFRLDIKAKSLALRLSQKSPKIVQKIKSKRDTKKLHLQNTLSPKISFDDASVPDIPAPISATQSASPRTSNKRRNEPMSSKSSSVVCRKIGMIGLRSTYVMSVGIHPRGHFIACGGLENTVSVYDMRETLNTNTGTLSDKVSIPSPTVLRFWSGYISSIRFFDDDCHMIVSSGDCTCTLVNHRSAKQLYTIHTAGDVLTIDFTILDDNPRKRARARVTEESLNANELSPIARSATSSTSKSTSSYASSFLSDTHEEVDSNTLHVPHEEPMFMQRTLFAIGGCDADDTILVADIRFSDDHAVPTFEAKHDDDTADVSIISQFDLMRSDVHSVRFSPNGQYLAAGGDAGIYRIYRREEDPEGRSTFQIVHERNIGAAVSQLTWVNDYTIAVGNNGRENRKDINNIIFITYWLQDNEVRKSIIRPFVHNEERMLTIILDYLGLDFVDTTISCSLSDKLSCLASNPFFQTPEHKQSMCRGLLVAGCWNQELEGFVNKSSNL